jgi:hypothetical protein
VIRRPVYPDPLIVLGRRKAKIKGGPAGRHFNREEVTAVEFLAVASNRIDFALGICGANEAFWTTAVSPGTYLYHLPTANGPFALHPYERGTKIEHQVIALSFRKRLEDPEAELRRGACDR